MTPPLSDDLRGAGPRRTAPSVNPRRQAECRHHRQGPRHRRGPGREPHEGKALHMPAISSRGSRPHCTRTLLASHRASLTPSRVPLRPTIVARQDPSAYRSASERGGRSAGRGPSSIRSTLSILGDFSETEAGDCSGPARFLASFFAVCFPAMADRALRVAEIRRIETLHNARVVTYICSDRRSWCV